MDDLTTNAENTWCPGCGNFGLFNAFKKAVRTLEDRGMSRDSIVFTAGIGQHAKIFDYLNLSGFYSLHGRGTVTAQGIKTGNPDLKAVSFGGDGDSFGEGLAHLMFAAKRNADVTAVIHDNGVYALTTGQFSPLSEKGYKGPSSPKGSIERPFNPLTLMLEAGATFVARGFTGQIDHLADLFAQAIEHKGFALVDVLQPCVTYLNTFKIYNKKTEIMGTVPSSKDEAVSLARQKNPLPIGIFYRADEPVFHEELYGDWNPAQKKMDREERRRKIRELM